MQKALWGSRETFTCTSTACPKNLLQVLWFLGHPDSPSYWPVNGIQVRAVSTPSILWIHSAILCWKENHHKLWGNQHTELRAGCAYGVQVWRLMVPQNHQVWSQTQLGKVTSFTNFGPTIKDRTCKPVLRISDQYKEQRETRPGSRAYQWDRVPMHQNGMLKAKRGEGD